MGDVPRVSGEILLDGVALPAKSFQVVSAGVSLSPEGRKVFAPLTVLETSTWEPSRSATRRR